MIHNAYEPLRRIPVRHACGHFELRLTRWGPNPGDTTGAAARDRGFLDASGSPCSTCDPQGRDRSAQYATLEDAQRVAIERNALEERAR